MSDSGRITVEEWLGMRCLDCGYALRGLASGRCPECGRAFDSKDPWTVRLPRRPNRLAQWLLRPPRLIDRLVPFAAIAATAWGSRVPGWRNESLHLGLMLLACCFIATWVWRLAVAHVRRRGYADRGRDEPYVAWRRQLRVATIVTVLLVALRPTMFLAFWASYPYLSGVAREVAAQPFSLTPSWGSRAGGLYPIGAVRRCPHGVKILVDSQPHRDPRDAGPGFFRRTRPGECSRFELGLPLGGGWYVSR